jgi:hypothetical protein
MQHQIKKWEICPIMEDKIEQVSSHQPVILDSSFDLEMQPIELDVDKTENSESFEIERTTKNIKNVMAVNIQSMYLGEENRVNWNQREHPRVPV